jgi:endonuclease/exonuclease/phosphatase family metal-dependent hydrolase
MFQMEGPVPDLRLAFWNVQNLFEPGVVDRGPQSATERDAKIVHLSAQINGFFSAAGPDVLGLAEVGTEAIFESIRGALNGQHLAYWEPPGQENQTGLGILVRVPPCSDLEHVATDRPTLASRPRVVLARITLAGVDEPFLLAVNHWKSRLQSGGVDDGADRMESSRWLGDLLAAEDRTTAAMVVGDFNAEPYEAPFNELGIRGKRHFSSAMWTGGNPAYLYNTAWRAMTEPALWEETNVSGYEESRPKTSHDTSPGVIFDQLLVSSRVLRNGPVTLQEHSVGYRHNDVLAYRSGTGVLRPRRWEYSNATTFSGASDHFPLLATLSF